MTRLNRGRWITHALLGLFLLFLGIVPQSVSSASKTPVVAEPKLDIDFVVDTSSRNFGQNLQVAKAAIGAYLENVNPSVRLGMHIFSGPATQTRILSVDQTVFRASLKALRTEQEADTNLFDSIDFAANAFDRKFDYKRQLVVVTDGFDSSSTKTLDEVATKLAGAGTRVDIIALDSIDADKEVTQQLASRTGGIVVRGVELANIKARAIQTMAWATPWAPPVIPEPSLFSKILASKIVLALGALLVFAALGVGVFMMLGPKPQAVKLLGDSADGKKDKGSSAVSGMVANLANVADKALLRGDVKKSKKGKKKGGISALLERAGMDMRPGEFLIISVVSGLACAALGYLYKGQILGIIALPLGMFILPRVVVKRKGKKRADAFSEQLSDTLQLLSSSLRAGQGLMQAIDSVAKEGDKPASEEFRRVTVEARLGRDLVDSLKGMCERLDSEDFGWVIPAIEINREVGGDLAEVLETVASTVRDRADIRRQVKTLSAEGKMSAYVLLGLPIGIALMVKASNPAYIGALLTGTGLWLSGAGVLLMVIGGVWLFKLCKIEF
jgi:tight adherence protein B